MRLPTEDLGTLVRDMPDSHSAEICYGSLAPNDRQCPSRREPRNLARTAEMQNFLDWVIPYGVRSRLVRV